MTDFNKVEHYYRIFDEWNRMEAPSGKLEFELTYKEIKKHLKQDDIILDLGGGPGRYTISLASEGYKVCLADISEELLSQASNRVEDLNINNVLSMDQVNAIDLSIYEDQSFDVVLLLGPLYHLTLAEERQKCLKEVSRVVKANGIVIASYIPFLSGAIGVVDRSFYAPSHVEIGNLSKVFEEGIFINASERGFQEGYYPTPSEVMELFNQVGFEMVKSRSVRGFGFNREEQIYELKDTNPQMYEKLMALLENTAEDPSILNLCAHALYVGRKANIK